MSTFSIQFKAMGSHMQAWLSTDSATNSHILNEVPVWFEEWEAELSRFRPTSELSRLNAHTGEWVQVSPVLFEVIADAREAAEMTNGIFNPLILDALEATGYDHSFDGQTFASHQSLSASKPVASWDSLQIDDDRQAVFLPAGIHIDLGGIAKGWAAQEAANRLSIYGPCLVDAGGDLVAYGSPDDSGGWIVNVPNLDESDDLFRLLLVDQAIATSGTDYRNWQRDNQTFHHLIDPRTGRPSESRIVRSTVVAPEAEQAVVWAKVSLMTQTFPEYPAIFVYQDGAVQSNLEAESK